MKQDTFIFNAKWREAIKDCPPEVRLEIYEAIIDYATKGEDMHLSPIAEVAFSFVRLEVDKNSDRYQEMCEKRRAAGKKGGGNPNFRKGQPNPYYQDKQKINKDKQALTEINTDKQHNCDNDSDYVESTNVSSRKKAEDKESQLTLPKESAEEVISYQAIANQWNDILGDRLPKVISVNQKRQPKVKLRLQELKAKNITTKDLFQRIAASTFLTGGGPRKWKATFDWVFDNPNNWVKVMEGTYDNEGQDDTQASQQQQAGANGKKLGPGEFYEKGGRRTYGTGKYTVPDDAPPRPSEQYYWNPSTHQWLVG